MRVCTRTAALSYRQIIALAALAVRRAGCSQVPAIEIIKDLLCWGARIAYSDPFVPTSEARRANPTVSLSAEMLGSADTASILTGYRAFDCQVIVFGGGPIVDTRYATRGLRGTESKIARF